MNSNSYIYDDYDSCRRRDCDNNRRRNDCDSRRAPAVSSATLKCGTPSTITIPILAAPGVTFPTTSVTVRNPEGSNCCTKLDFTSNIAVPVGFTGTISFQVFRQCRNQFTPVPVGPAFTFSELVAVVIGETTTFSFFICDCDSGCDDDDCCTYSVVITNLSAITVGLTITNATLSALTTCSENNCNC